MKAFLCCLAVVIPMCKFNQPPEDPLRLEWKRYGLPAGKYWPLLLALALTGCQTRQPDPAAQAIEAAVMSQVVAEIMAEPMQ